MRSKGVNAPGDLRNDFCYSSSLTIHQAPSMNFNGLRTTSPAWRPEVTGFQSGSSTNWHGTWRICLFCQERCEFLFLFRSAGHAVPSVGQEGNTKPLCHEYKVTYGLAWKIQPTKSCDKPDSRSSGSPEVWFWSSVAAYRPCGHRRVTSSFYVQMTYL